MQSICSYKDLENISLEYDEYWTQGNKKPALMHSIHNYPAKFPPFIVEKAINYAVSEGVKVKTIADIFCGCGTTALEAKSNNYSFWGCDINPVATLISRTKVANYDIQQLKQAYDEINRQYSISGLNNNPYLKAPERLKYWFSQKQYNDLFRLLTSIESSIPKENTELKDAFLCLFSSILKKSSKWLQKSIKPQVDPKKTELDVMELFKKQYKSFEKANDELKKKRNKKWAVPGTCIIKTANCLEFEDNLQVDLIITSPPYVTSYEYADLHQLSSLWLGYTSDYRKLRSGMIGSGYGCEACEEKKLNLNSTATDIIENLKNAKCQRSKWMPVARYYSEMQKATKKCYSFLTNGGMSLFVIGDSEINGVQLRNAEHLIESMITEGFTDVKISKRVVSKGICVPYRDSKGRFTHNKETKNTIYSEEYIVSGRKTWEKN